MDNERCLSYADWKARSGLPISVTAEVLGANIDWKSAFSFQQGQFAPKNFR